MGKNTKLAVKTSILISLFLFISLFGLWSLINKTCTDFVFDNITNHMTDAAETRSFIIQNYVDTSEQYLTAFSKSDAIVNLVKNPDDPEAFKIAQQYTLEMAAVKGNFEGLFLCDYGMKTLTHSNEGTIGIVLREGERLKAFQDTVLSKQELTNIGILKSPNSGEMVISMYQPIYVDGECLGFVGGAVYASRLMEDIEAIKVEGLPDCEYVFLNAENGEYLYNKDENLLSTVTEDNGYLEIIDEVKANPNQIVGDKSYTDNSGIGRVVVYRYLPERNWIFALRDKQENVYSSLNAVKLATSVGFVSVGVLIIFIIVIALLNIGKHLNRIKKSIETLGEMDLSADKALVMYDKRTDEIGAICSAINKTCLNLRKYIGEVDNLLALMANGDFTQCNLSEFIGDFTVLKKSLESIQSSLSDSFVDIHTVTSELVLGSESVENSASSLANAAVQANSLISEIDENVIRISEQLSDTAEAANTAKSQAKEAEEIVGLSREKMAELSEALALIEESAASIESISGKLEDIAKQTNILSLNALVEASRAGDVGRGFSVVANEIRTLAEESANASAESFEKISQAITSVNKGLKIGKEAEACLDKVVSQTSVIDNSVSQIAEAADSQNIMLKDIRQKLNNISQTVETTAAMAEQSAAASTELDGQINALRNNIGQYKINR